MIPRSFPSWLAAAIGVVGMAWTAQAGEPCGVCQAVRPCESEAPPRSRIVVHVPPPEVVFQPAPGCLFQPKCRMFHHGGDRCAAPAQTQSSVTAALLTPVATQTFGSLT